MAASPQIAWYFEKTPDKIPENAACCRDHPDIWNQGLTTSSAVHARISRKNILIKLACIGNRMGQSKIMV